MFVIDHFMEFGRCFPSPLPFVAGDEREGHGPEGWFKRVNRSKLDLPIGQLPVSVNRASLLAMAADHRVGTAELCISIFAWGGMHGKNRDYLFGCPMAPWVAIAEQVRDDKLSRSEAYDSFATLRNNGKGSAIAGMGPAYFTKLLYFLAPGLPGFSKGYIMDQWLGCSINLLTGREIVKLDQHVTWKIKKGQAERSVDSYVSNVNCGQDYDAFCRAVEALSAKLGEAWTPELTERALIADGGKVKHPWRGYVIKERLKLFSFE
jgi:hypothetical protein